MALTNKLTAIGDAIREKTGKSALLSLDQMPVEIRAIETGGGSGGDSHEWEDNWLQGNYNANIFTKYDYENDRITKIADYKMAVNAYNTISLPNVEQIDQYGLYRSNYAEKIILPKLKSVGNYGLTQAQAIADEIWELPLLETAGKNAFQQSGHAIKKPILLLPSLKTVDEYCFNESTFSAFILPSLEMVGVNTFASCRNITEINLPKLTNISRTLFSYCSNLKKIDIGGENVSIATDITYDFYSPINGCDKLETLILRSNTLITNPSRYVIHSTSTIVKGTGYIYVPAALLEDYKVAANWSVYASQFRAIEDYPEICGEA